MGRGAPANACVRGVKKENHISLGELAVDEKSNEITALPELLDLLDIEGDIVTIDAIDCQTNIAGKIREAGADYVLSLKDNQLTLHRAVAEYFDWIEKEHPKDEPTDSCASRTEKAHVRIETRRITTASADWLPDKGKWADIQTLIRYRCTRELNGVKTESVRHYISSFDTSAEGFMEMSRGHWSIENKLHWMLDVVFREDKARARKDNWPLNLNILRKISLALIKKTPAGRLGVRKRMMKAARNPSFLARVVWGE
jgi:predicted transposase YbfD/YdcC